MARAAKANPAPSPTQLTPRGGNTPERLPSSRCRCTCRSARRRTCASIRGPTAAISADPPQRTAYSPAKNNFPGADSARSISPSVSPRGEESKRRRVGLLNLHRDRRRGSAARDDGGLGSDRLQLGDEALSHSSGASPPPWRTVTFSLPTARVKDEGAIPEFDAMPLM